MPRPHIHIHWPGGKHNLLLEDEGETPPAPPVPRAQAKPPSPQQHPPAVGSSSIAAPAARTASRKPGQGGEHFGAIVKTLQGQGFEAAVSEIAQRFGQACAQRFARTAEAQGMKEALAELEAHAGNVEDALRRHSTSRDGSFGSSFRGGLQEQIEGATKDARGGCDRQRLIAASRRRGT